MQRVAIARALVSRPELLLADEPTANLDQTNSGIIFQLFQELAHRGLTVVVVTHNPALARAASRRIYLEDGKIVSQD
jgi:putative ABC transport system ATP-binding protein